jgi:hypothetical protein
MPLLVAVLLSFALLLGGCGERDTKPTRFREMLKIEEVPDDIMAVAKEALPGVEFSDGWKNLRPDGTFDSYEIRGRNAQGKTREVRVSPSGEILEME